MKTSLKNKLAVIALAGSLGNSGCLAYTTYKTIPPAFVPVLTVPFEQPENEFRQNGLLDCQWKDCGKLTWQEAIAQIHTPEQAQTYLDSHFSPDYDEVGGKYFYFFFPTWGFITKGKGESFKYNHAKAKGICLDYATAAAALLSDDGYTPLLLMMQDNNPPSSKHMVYLYQTKEGYNALGISPLKRGYPSIDALIRSLNQTYGFNFNEYGVINLDNNFTREEWVSGDVDLQIPLVDKWIKLKGEYK